MDESLTRAGRRTPSRTSRRCCSRSRRTPRHSTSCAGPSPRRPRRQRPTLSHLADDLLAADRPADALVAVTGAIEHYREVVADRPEHRCWLDEKLVKAANCHVRLGRSGEARLVLEEAIASLEATAGSGRAVSMQDQSASTDDEPGQWLAEARTLLASL